MKVVENREATGESYYFGEGGQFGPFTLQVEGEWAGWPEFGQVSSLFSQESKTECESL